jgi:hypothetical protein
MMISGLRQPEPERAFLCYSMFATEIIQSWIRFFQVLRALKPLAAEDEKLRTIAAVWPLTWRFSA